MFTVDILESNKACLSQIRLFKEHFPNGSPLTVESALSVASVFNWGWAAHNLLSAKGIETYKEQAASLRKTCKEQTAPLYKTYEDQAAPLWKTCKEQTASLYKTYEDQVASLFASIYISEQ
jgi:hypothetical protein